MNKLDSLTSHLNHVNEQLVHFGQLQQKLQKSIEFQLWRHNHPLVQCLLNCFSSNIDPIDIIVICIELMDTKFCTKHMHHSFTGNCFQCMFELNISECLWECRGPLMRDPLLNIENTQFYEELYPNHHEDCQVLQEYEDAYRKHTQNEHYLARIHHVRYGNLKLENIQGEMGLPAGTKICFPLMSRVIHTMSIEFR